jgi:hypothetical protein
LESRLVSGKLVQNPCSASRRPWVPPKTNNKKPVKSKGITAGTKDQKKGTSPPALVTECLNARLLPLRLKTPVIGAR